MITLVLTYRNRDLRIVKNCLNSLAHQSEKDFRVILVDYGSDLIFAEGIVNTVSKYEFVSLISCPTRHQLWSKARAINLALRESASEFFLVGDVDMIFKSNFIDKACQLKEARKVTYFQVGFLSHSESLQNKDFSNYLINHFSTKDATGISMFPKSLLMEINGYDEFYHGWGSEDTDVHNRISKLGVPIHFYDSEVLLLHQWHEKSYRSLKSEYPFHTALERVNQKYLEYTQTRCSSKANIGQEWGLPAAYKAYEKLNDPDEKITLSNEKNELKAFVLGGVFQLNSCVEITLERHEKINDLKNTIKRKVGKKSIAFFDLEESNNLLLEMIIVHFRNLPYRYKYDLNRQEIILTINLNP